MLSKNFEKVLCIKDYNQELYEFFIEKGKKYYIRIENHTHIVIIYDTEFKKIGQFYNITYCYNYLIPYKQHMKSLFDELIKYEY